jgi:hypothetical protein
MGTGRSARLLSGARTAAAGERSEARTWEGRVAVTVVWGRQSVAVVERSERADDDATPEVCTLGRGSLEQPVSIRLGTSLKLSRRAVEVRCVDGAWWQVR